MPRINELPESERPRERLISLGAALLSNQELIALLIGSGTKGESAMSLASRVIGSTDEGILWIQSASVEELSSIGGIGDAIACRLLAAAELGRRMSVQQGANRVLLTSPDDAALLFMEEMRYLRNEVFRVLMLNVRGEMLGKETVSLGSVSASLVDAREVFRPAIRRGAASIMLVHNHPSGNPSPSPQDIGLTETLAEAGELLGIKVVDHLISGDGCFASLRQLGHIGAEKTRRASAGGAL